MNLLAAILWGGLGLLGLWEIFYFLMKKWNCWNELKERVMILPIRKSSENLELLLREVILREGGDFPILLADFGAGEELKQTAFLLQHDYPEVRWVSREMICSELMKNLCLKTEGKYIIIDKITEKQREVRHETEGTEYAAGKRR